MPKVFVTQEPPNKASTRTKVFDLRPAEKFGQIVYLSNRIHINRLILDNDSSYMMEELRNSLIGFTDKDFLIPIGHPVIMMAAGVVAAERTGGIIQVLVWDSRYGTYDPVRLDTRVLQTR